MSDRFFYLIDPSRITFAQWSQITLVRDGLGIKSNSYIHAYIHVTHVARMVQEDRQTRRRRSLTRSVCRRSTP